jgi:hypothetical protein
MGERPRVLTRGEMRRVHGAFYQKSPKVRLDKKKVPEKYWHLLPYAEFWGIADDLDREQLVEDAPPDVQQNLKDVIVFYDNKLNEWLAGPESYNPNPTDEYVAFQL